MEDTKLLDKYLQDKQKGLEQNNFYFFKEAFSHKECDKIIDSYDHLVSKARTFNAESASDEEQDKVRRSKVHWVNKDSDSQWIFDRYTDLVYEANNNIYRFDICGMSEAFQYTKYDSAEQGFYNAHTDWGAGYYTRKISIVLQLSDPDSYEGGELQIHNDATPAIGPKDRGSTILFPSLALHGVQPVTKGIRRSLVLWVSGPPFR
jgi:PKHD-type hydroxylase